MAQHKENLIEFDKPSRFRDIKIPSFWSDRPASWFALAEACFRSHGIVSEQAKFELSARRVWGEFWTWWR